ncbi:MAG: hypothetical protein LV479_00465 [Methylacidiphilales bacterium]|nr:hypothetical protein [Candidatus Methylacidiphilales bacterium]
MVWEMDGILSRKFYRIGQLAASLPSRHSALSGQAYRWPRQPDGFVTLTAFMKKSSHLDHLSESRHRSHEGCPQKGAKEGRWAFNLASESLFALGSTEGARRVAYRTATGELRFLPI